MPMPKGEGFTNSIHPSPIPFQLSVRKVGAKKTHEPFGQLNVSQHASCFAESYEGPIKASYGTRVLLKGLRENFRVEVVDIPSVSTRDVYIKLCFSYHCYTLELSLKSPSLHHPLFGPTFTPYRLF